jgi:ADP-ribosyl-[dinitrogen reductase] hydrolase
LKRKQVLDSINSPLRIDSLQTPGGGRIGMTICPGKKILHGHTGAWDRDLDLDIRAISQWRADAVVTLMEHHEFTHLRVPGLGEAVEAAGLQWHHLPIRDVSVPNGLFETLWIYSGHRLRTMLASGATVLVHCRGGLGRSGMIAARLLVEMGAKADDAIQRVRMTRPGAIETAAQEKYVRAVKRSEVQPILMDPILGCLLGGAAGDALGYAVEFDSWDAIRDRFGDAGIAEPVSNHGEINVSDDTQMTLFTLEGLLRSKTELAARDFDGVVANIRQAYLDWLNTQEGGRSRHGLFGQIAADPRLRRAMAPGLTCLSALRAGGHGTVERPLNDSKGCGGVMRVAPIGLMASSPEDAAELAARAAALTHGHPSGYWSAAAMAAMIRMALDGAGLDDSARKASAIISRRDGAHETVAMIDAALKAASAARSDHRQAIASLGDGGWCGDDALAIGLYSALRGKSFPQVLSIAANHDGDSDSTASIAGQLYGASKGLADLPNQWIRRLDVLEILLGLVRASLA